MAHADIHALGVIYQLQKAHHVIEIIQRFTDAHENNVGDGLAGIQLGIQHLVQNLRRLQRANQAADGGGAEGTALAAAHLGGDTDGVAVLIAHDNGFYGVAVLQLPQVFDGAVQPGDLLAQHLGLIQVIGIFQFFPQGLGEIGHLIKASYAPAQPFKDLLGSELLLAHGQEIRLDLLGQHG